MAGQDPAAQDSAAHRTGTARPPATYQPAGGTYLSPQEVQHRLSADDAERLGLRGWRRWVIGAAAGTPGRARFQVGIGVFGGSCQLALQLHDTVSAEEAGVWAGLLLVGSIFFYALAVVTYVTLRGNLDRGVYERLDQARREEAAHWEERFARRREQARGSASSTDAEPHT